jgi:hypothetical protein
MMKFSCTRVAVSDIFYATLIAESADEAKQMALDEVERQWLGEGGKLRNWTVGIIERDVDGPARVLDSGRRDT